MKDLEKLIRLQSFLKSYIQTKKQNEQINIKLIGNYNKKASTNLHYNSIKIEEYTHEIHCLCVELGFADFRENEYYKDTTINFGSIEMLIKKRKPNVGM
jgi:hypothetical protein